MCNNSLERVNLEIEFKTILQTGQEIMKYNGYNLFVEKHLYKNFAWKYILLTSRKYFYVFIDVFNTNVRHSSKIYLLKNKINAFINSGTVQLIIKA